MFGVRNEFAYSEFLELEISLHIVNPWKVKISLHIVNFWKVRNYFAYSEFLESQKLLCI